MEITPPHRLGALKASFRSDLLLQFFPKINAEFLHRPDVISGLLQQADLMASGRHTVCQLPHRRRRMRRAGTDFCYNRNVTGRPLSFKYACSGPTPG